MRKFRIKVDGEEYIVEVEEINDEGVSNKPSSNKSETDSYKTTSVASGSKKPVQKSPQINDAKNRNELTAPMPGKILDIKVKEGQKVEKGEVLIILEAMKLENNISAPYAAEIKEIKTEIGKNVESGELLIKLG